MDTVQPLIQQSVFAKVTSDMFRGGSSSRGRGGSRATTSTPSSSGTVFDRLGGSGGDGAVSTTVFDRLGGKSSSSRNQTTTFTVSI